jgi:Ca2+-transporting ATPase
MSEEAVYGLRPSSLRAEQPGLAKRKNVQCKLTSTSLPTTTNRCLTFSTLLAMAPTLMMGTIAASHAWTQPGSLSDPTQTDPSRSSAALWEGKLQLHPETSPEDPLYQRFGGSQQSHV